MGLAPAAVRLKEARLDAGLSQAELAARAGTAQANIAAIEAGRRKASPEMLRRLLEAADYRPSVPLARVADEIVRRGERIGLRSIRVFGSAARGDDHYGSDIDLLVEAGGEVGGLAFGSFVADVEELTGFPVDAVVDRQGNPALDAIRETAVPL